METNISTLDIFDFIIKKIEDSSGKKVKTKNIGNGYYLFNFGDNTVCHFTMEGAKDWLFGIWAIPQEDGSIQIDLFGEHEWCMDKFKPSATKISESYTLKQNENLNVISLEFYRTIEAMALISNYPIYGYLKYYWDDSQESPIHMYICDWIFYRIEKPIIEWKRNQINNFLAKIYKIYAKFRWGKYINIDIIDSKEEGFEVWPRFTFKVTFVENVSEDVIEKIYYKIKKFKFFDENCRISFYEFNDKRPFCLR